MSRRQNPDRTLLYRAVVEFPSSAYFSSGPHYYGPYSTRGQAKATLKRENRKWNDLETPIHPEHIEVSELDWKVDE